MKSISILVYLSFILFFSQTIVSFCIYNMFEDNTFFTITDARSNVRRDRIFRKEMHSGSVECCHFSNRDCSNDGKDDEENSFHVYFNFLHNRVVSNRKLVHCTTGGALVFSGNNQKFISECKFANGTMVTVEMTDDDLPFAKFNTREDAN